MVHALRDAWRVLGLNGALVDLRPLSVSFPVDAIVGSDAIRVGEASAATGAEDDLAANRSIRAQVESGWLTPRHRAEFDIHFYWDTTAEMADYMRSGRTLKRVTPWYSEIDAALQALSGRARSSPRLRCTRRMMLGSYAKAREREAHRR
jgi:hypothetical protein